MTKPIALPSDADHTGRDFGKEELALLANHLLRVAHGFFGPLNHGDEVVDRFRAALSLIVGRVEAGQELVRVLAKEHRQEVEAEEREPRVGIQTAAVDVHGAARVEHLDVTTYAEEVEVEVRRCRGRRLGVRFETTVPSGSSGSFTS